MISFDDSVKSFASAKAEDDTIPDDFIIDDGMDTAFAEDDESLNDENQRSEDDDDSGTGDGQGQDSDDSADTSDFEEQDDTAEESDFEEQDDVDEEDAVEEIELDEDFYGEYSDAEPIAEDEEIETVEFEDSPETDSDEYIEADGEIPGDDIDFSEGEELEEVGTDLDIDDFSDFLDELFTDEPLDQEDEEGLLGVDYWSEFGVDEPFEELGFDTDSLSFMDSG